MKSIFLVSNCIKCLDLDSMTTSSQKYEYLLAKHLSKYVDVKILSKACIRPSSQTTDNIELIGVKDGPNNSILSNFGVLNILKKQKEKVYVIFWGYDLITVIFMLMVKMYNVTCIPFVFDSHRPAIRNYKLFKRILAEIYFSLGKFLIRFFDGFILFQKKAVEKLKIGRKPHLVIKPGIVDSPNELMSRKSDVYNVAFCGTLSKLNGIDVLLKSLEYLKNLPIAVHLCGSGDLIDDVYKATNKYPFLKYYGVLSNQGLLEIYRKSDLLLNIRVLDDEAMDYAFPSKTFEYISVGKPLLTTKVLSDDVFLENVILLEKLSPEVLAEKILFAIQNNEIAKSKAIKLKEYIENQYSFDSSAKKVINFISNV